MNVKVRKLGIGVVVTVDDHPVLEISPDTAREMQLDLERVLKDIEYEAWLDLVQREVYKLVPVHLDDMVDFCYRDYFDNGASPVEVSIWVLEESGYEEKITG